MSAKTDKWVPTWRGLRMLRAPAVLATHFFLPFGLGLGFTHAQVLPGDRAANECQAWVAKAKPTRVLDALDLAVCHNPQVKSATAAIAVRNSGLGEAGAAYGPNVSATLSRLRNDTSYSDIPDSNTANVGTTVSMNMTWRIFDFGGREANQSAANNLLQAAMAGHEATLQKVMGSVVRAYYEVLTAKSMVDLKAETLNLLEATLRSAQQRESKGAAALTDVLQAQSAQLKEYLGIIRAKSEYEKALAALVNAIGVEAGTQLQVEEELSEPDTVEPIPAAEVWLAYVQDRHPAIVAAQAQLAEAEKRVVVSRSEGLPSLDFSGTLYKNGSPSQGLAAQRSLVTNVGVVLNLPLYDSNARSYKTSGAQAQVAQINAQLLETRYQVQAQLLQSLADAQAARKNLAYSATLLSIAYDTVATTIRRYDKGVTDIQDLLNVKVALAQARQERTKSLIEWRSARLQLLANAGLLGRTRAAAAGLTDLPFQSQMLESAPKVKQKGDTGEP